MVASHARAVSSIYVHVVEISTTKILHTKFVMHLATFSNVELNHAGLPNFIFR